MEKQSLFTYVNLFLGKFTPCTYAIQTPKHLQSKDYQDTVCEYASAILTNIVRTKQKFQYKKYSPSLD